MAGGCGQEEQSRDNTIGMQFMLLSNSHCLTYLLDSQTKAMESPITRIFGGKFRTTLKAPHQRDSVTVEDWRSLRLDIQVCSYT